jgi:hypothetical protein
MTTDTVPARRSNFAVVLDAVPEPDRSIVSLDAMLRMNTGGGRPSDAARAAVASYEALGVEEFTHRHYRAKRTALESCPCSACFADSGR